MSTFCQKRPFSKNKQLSCPYFVKKTSTLLKTKCSRVIFSFFFYKNPILLCPYLVKKRIFCQNYTILWAIKVNKMPFFPDFLLKNRCSRTQFILKYVYSLKNKLLSSPCFVKKRSFRQKHCALMSFYFQFFSKNPLLSSPYLVKKRRFCQNYTIFWVKKVNRMPFVSDFSRKNNSSNAHILSKNRPFSENSLLLSPYYVKKTSILTKTKLLSYNYYQIFH